MGLHTVEYQITEASEHLVRLNFECDWDSRPECESTHVVMVPMEENGTGESKELRSSCIFAHSGMTVTMNREIVATVVAN